MRLNNSPNSQSHLPLLLRMKKTILMMRMRRSMVIPTVEAVEGTILLMSFG
jgi:hypothetical protein